MVNLQTYYTNARLSINASPSLCYKIEKLFDQVIMQLPDDEGQFRIGGTTIVGSREEIVNFYREAVIDPKTSFGSSMNLSVNDGNYTSLFRRDLGNATYLITIITDGLNEKSDDYIKGLIAYKISGCSYAWKIARPVWNEPGDLDEHMAMLNQRIAPIGSEEYERNVDEEAKRLGFANELLAYYTQS